MLGWPNGSDRPQEKPVRRPAWPNNIPHDLRTRLEGVMGHRSYGPADIWGEVKDWLEKHHVRAPERLPDEPRR